MNFYFKSEEPSFCSTSALAALSSSLLDSSPLTTKRHIAPKPMNPPKNIPAKNAAQIILSLSFRFRSDLVVLHIPKPFHRLLKSICDLAMITANLITMCTAHRAGAVETPARRLYIRAPFDSSDPFIYKIHLLSLPCSPFGPFLFVQPRLNFRFGLLLLVVFLDDLRIEPASCSKTRIRGFVHAGVRAALIYVSSQIITSLTLCFSSVF